MGSRMTGRSAVMHDAVVGEHIARTQAGLNAQDEAGAENLRGSPWTPSRVRVRRTEQGKAAAD